MNVEISGLKMPKDVPTKKDMLYKVINCLENKVFDGVEVCCIFLLNVVADWEKFDEDILYSVL
jgi:hypothetical protein